MSHCRYVNKTYNLTDAKQLTHDGFKEATADMWRLFCRHVVDIENNYIEKDGILEDAVEEMTIDLGESDDDDDDDSDWEDSLLDDDDRRLIDRSLEQSSLSTHDKDPVMSAARNLSEQFWQDFLDAVLPLP